MIKLCHPAMERNLDAVLNRLAILEQKVAKGVVVSSQSSGGGAAGGDADGISGLQSENGVQVQPGTEGSLGRSSDDYRSLEAGDR